MKKVARDTSQSKQNESLLSNKIIPRLLLQTSRPFLIQNHRCNAGSISLYKLQHCKRNLKQQFSPMSSSQAYVIRDDDNLKESRSQH